MNDPCHVAHCLLPRRHSGSCLTGAVLMPCVELWQRFYGRWRSLM